MLVTAIAVLATAKRSDAQTHEVGGEVSHHRPARVDPTRLSARVPGVDSAMRARVRVPGDSAQRIALDDFEWHGRVLSLEVDEEDSRVFWDVKIVPDSSQSTVVRYRVDASTGGIMSIKEFTGLRGLARRP